jgi:hypothetical protein
VTRGARAHPSDSGHRTSPDGMRVWNRVCVRVVKVLSHSRPSFCTRDACLMMKLYPDQTMVDIVTMLICGAIMSGTIFWRWVIAGPLVWQASKNHLGSQLGLCRWHWSISWGHCIRYWYWQGNQLNVKEKAFDFVFSFCFSLCGESKETCQWVKYTCTKG